MNTTHRLTVRADSVLDLISTMRIAFEMNHGKPPRFVVLGPTMLMRLKHEIHAYETYTPPEPCASLLGPKFSLKQVYGLEVVAVASDIIEIGW